MPRRKRRGRRKRRVRRSFTSTPIYTSDKKLLRKIAKDRGIGLTETLHQYIERDAKRRGLF